MPYLICSLYGTALKNRKKIKRKKVFFKKNRVEAAFNVVQHKKRISYLAFLSFIANFAFVIRRGFYYYVMNKLQMNDVAKRSTLIAFAAYTGVYIMPLLMVTRWLLCT